MLRYLLLATFVITGLVTVGPTRAHAQDTNQTDASEEDWRNSRRKRKTSGGFDPITNPSGIGTGGTLPPVRPIDQLPEDSRRHLQRQRAKVIAELEFGEEPGDAPFEPSDAAKSDPQLAADEEAVWETIVTDLQGSSGSDAQGQSGPNKVAIVGQGGGGSSGSVTRGGSAQSAADILAQLKGLQSAGQTPSGAQGGGTGAGQAQQDQSRSQSGQAQPGQTQQAGAQPGNPQEGTDRSGQSASGQTGEGSDGQGQQGSGEANPSDGGASSGNETGGGDGTGASDDTSSTADAPSVDPLNLPERPSALGDGSGNSSSASDYLKDAIGAPRVDTQTKDGD